MYNNTQLQLLHWRLRNKAALTPCVLCPGNHESPEHNGHPQHLSNEVGTDFFGANSLEVISSEKVHLFHQ
ncbi:unnamed protein product [Rhizophagus irregularis]|nr:unnamed protein product [Rhizophagus irregularis]